MIALLTVDRVIIVGFNEIATHKGAWRAPGEGNPGFSRVPGTVALKAGSVLRGTILNYVIVIGC